MGTQTITYGEITFPYSRLSVSEQAVLAEDGASVIGTRYRFQISGLITSDGPMIPLTGTTLGTPAALEGMIRQMRRTLSNPRKGFQVALSDGTTQSLLYNIGPQNAPSHYQVSSDWGPIPGELSIDRFAGGLAASYSWSLEATVKECFGSQCAIQGTATNILAITRQFAHTIDASGYTTRMISGSLLVCSQSVAAGRPADAYRYTVTPPIPCNYHRIAQSFEQSADGRELRFSFTDQEVMYTLPQPITEGQANWMVRVGEAASLMVDYVLSGWFKAPPSINKATIIGCIYDLMMAKFPMTDPGLYFESREISESIYDNRIEFNIRATSGGGVDPNADGKGVLGNGASFGTGLDTFAVSPPNTETGTAWPVFPDGGDANNSSGTIAPKFVPWDACVGSNPLDSKGVKERGNVPFDPGEPTERDTGTTNPNQVSPDHLKAPYVAYHEVISYEVDNRVVCFEPKVAGLGPVIQQTSPPVLVVIQAGYAVRYARSVADGPKVPKPVLGDGGVVLQSYISPAVPEPVGDGSANRYTVHWRHVSRYKKAIKKFLECEPIYPRDPRRLNDDSIDHVMTADETPEVVVSP